MQTSKSPHLLLFSLLVLPMVINPVVALSFDEVYLQPKILWIYAVIFPSALLLIWQQRQKLKWDITLVFAVLFFLCLCFSSLLTTSIGLNLWGAPDRADGLLMHVMYLVLMLSGLLWAPIAERKTSGLKFIFTGLLILLALTNIAQQLHIMGVPGAGASSGVAATLFGGTQGNRGYMGGTLALLLPMLVWLASREHQPRWKWCLFLGVILVTWALCGTLTRAVWLAGLAGVVALFWWSRSSRRVWPFLLAGVLAFIMTAEVNSNRRTFGGQVQEITNSSGRGVLWKSALKGIQQKPLLGWGQQGLWKVMAEQDTEVLLRMLNSVHYSEVRRLGNTPSKPPSFIVTQSDGHKEMLVLSINKVHNEYLDYALTYGVPAGLLFIVILGSAIWFGRTSVPGIAAGLVAYAIYLFLWPEVIRFAPLAWFMMGISLSRSPLNEALRPDRT